MMRNKSQDFCCTIGNKTVFWLKASIKKIRPSIKKNPPLGAGLIYVAVIWGDLGNIGLRALHILENLRAVDGLHRHRVIVCDRDFDLAAAALG